MADNLGLVMVGFGNDLRYALRTVVRHPAFSATAVVVLALGIAANAVAFSFVNSLFLRPLPGVEQPGRLVRIYTSYDRGPRYFTVSYPDYRDARDLRHVFSDALAEYPTPLHLGAGQQHERIWAYIVTSNYFSVLGVRPAIGRLFQLDDDQVPSRSPVVVLSHGLWKRRFGADSRILGRTITLNGHPFTVIGVAPEGFHGVNVGLEAELWAPEALLPWGSPETRSSSIERRGARGYFVMGRLRPEVTVEQARAAVAVLSRRLQATYPASNRGVTLSVLTEAEGGVHPLFRRGFVGFSAALAIVVGLVLVLACTNVAGLLLARAAGRRREIGVRLALGASRVRIIRQLLTESLLLWAIAGTAGAGLAASVVNMIASIELPTDRPIFVDIGVDVRVLGFSILATVLTGLIFGLLPALAVSRADVIASLKDSGQAVGFRSPLRSAIIASQVALCAVLLIGAGLCMRSLASAYRLDLGIDPDDVAMASVNLQLQGYTDARAEHFLDDLVRRLSSLPGVDSVGLANRIPFELNIIRTSVAPVGRGPSTELRAGPSTGVGADPSTQLGAGDPGWPSVDWAAVNDGYFKALRVPLREGRGFDERDTPASAAVVVNETLARRLWPGERAVGRRVVVAGRMREVVGVAKDGKYLTLGEEPTAFVYLPFGGPAATVLVRASGGVARWGPTTMLSRLRQDLGAMDPTLPLYNVKTMREHLEIALIPASVGAALLGVFGALALLLASVGLYGLLACLVAQRTQEIGVRRALGAQDADVMGLVVRHAMSPVIIGLIAGLVLGLVVSPFLRALLYGIGPTDPLAYAVALATLLLTAAVACYVPARRAARIEPMVALREE